MRGYDDFEEDDYEGQEDEDYGYDERTSQVNPEEEPMIEENGDEFDESVGDHDDDEEDDEEEEQDDEDEDDEEDEEGDDAEEGDEDEDEEEGEDVDMTNGQDGLKSSPPLREISPSSLPVPPHLNRRALFSAPTVPSGISPSIEAIVAIPNPAPIYSLASTACLSYLLTGSSEGYVRAYDFWGSVNGKQMMTAQQRTLVGLGEGVNKAGVTRGWWANEVAKSVQDGNMNGVNGVNGVQEDQARLEPVYSMAMESDGLWALTGTKSGQINLYTLRHSPGHFVHALKGHSSVVSCMTLLPGEKSFLSGSWDGSLREWDLNTGQTVRTYPTHGAQISSLSLRPYFPASPPPSHHDDGEGDGEANNDDEDMTITNGDKDDLFDGSDKATSPKQEVVEKDFANDNDKAEESAKIDGSSANGDSENQVDGDITMNEDNPSPYDPLFDDDADGEGEDVPSSNPLTLDSTPNPLDLSLPSAGTNLNTAKPSNLQNSTKPTQGLALPGMNPSVASVTGTGTGMTSSPAAGPSTGLQVPSSATTASTPFFSMPLSSPGPSRHQGAASTIPTLDKNTYKSFSEDVLLYSSMDGQVTLVDRRVPSSENGSSGVGRLMGGDKAPPWCMSACWSSNGTQVLAGRRNGTIDIWDVRKPSSTSSSSPNLLRTLRTPLESGPISCVASIAGGHVATASTDNIRLWNTVEYFDEDNMKKKTSGTGGSGGSRPPFKIIAGHHGGTISSMLVDPTCRFLITASGDRGWQGESTKTVLIHEIKW